MKKESLWNENIVFFSFQILMYFKYACILLDITQQLISIPPMRVLLLFLCTEHNFVYFRSIRDLLRCTFNIGDMIWKVTCFYRLKVHMYLQNININDKIYIIHMPTLHNRDNDDDWVEPIQLRRNILLSSTSLRIKLTSQKFRWFIAVVTIITR